MKKCLMGWKNASNRNVIYSHKERNMSDRDLINVASGGLALDDELLKMGGMGTENVKSKDVLIPRLVILQSMSPQVNKKKAEFIEGAEIGDFCNVATGDLYKEKILVVPCHFETSYIEWTKNRGGLAGNHGSDPKILSQTIKNDKFENVLPNGNIVQEQAQWYCLLQEGASWNRVFFPLKSTNMKHSKKWLTLVQSETVQLPSGEMWKPPMFWRSWNLIIVDASNDQGDWFTFRPEKSELIMDLDPTRQLIRMCKSFYEDIRTNVVKPDIEQTQDEGGNVIDGTVNRDPKDPMQSNSPL
jgi:hypothetical protein